MKLENGKKYEIVLKDYEMWYGSAYYKNGKWWSDEKCTIDALRYGDIVINYYPLNFAIVKGAEVKFTDQFEVYKGYFDGKYYCTRDGYVKMDDPMKEYIYQPNLLHKFLYKLSRLTKVDFVNLLSKELLFKNELNEYDIV